jgi:hypothetical protein
MKLLMRDVSMQDVFVKKEPGLKTKVIKRFFSYRSMETEYLPHHGNSGG